ncbi:MAG: hypothetical protein L3J88_08575 [Gammaproteobacteria bacterium]|nr:hypothetical protein [Gammaproteobacteria bacterium]MCF6363382.1 hypothetical protein [Gammaproteobacteria bacterium]
MSLNGLIEKGNKCLEERENIPGSPLWHMGKVAVFESKDSFDFLQSTIDYLTCKGKLNKNFTGNEKEFMKELFEALWWGGKYHGFHEAAKLANHYVNGEGQTLKIDSEIYKSSVIVSDTMLALKRYIRDKSDKNKSIALSKTGNPDFLRSSYATALKQGKRSAIRQGYLLSGGALLVEQSNIRLKNADHRFHLLVYTTKGSNSNFMSRWKVESLYDFEPFTKNYITEIPLAKDFILKLPDGLSHYLTKIAVAKNFKYTSGWIEAWK